MKSAVKHCNSFPRAGLSKKPCSVPPWRLPPRPVSSPGQERAESPALEPAQDAQPLGTGDCHTTALVPDFQHSWGLPRLGSWGSGLFGSLAHSSHRLQTTILLFIELLSCNVLHICIIHALLAPWSNCYNFNMNFPYLVSSSLGLTPEDRGVEDCLHSWLSIY